MTIPVSITLNQATLSRCHACNWVWEADDTEFPTRIEFELRYDVDSDGPCIRSLRPIHVSVRGAMPSPASDARLFTHDLTESERNAVWLWWQSTQWRVLQAGLLESMALAVESDIESRTDRTDECFLQLAAER